MSSLNIPAVQRSAVPLITTEEMMEVDRLMVEEYGIQLMQMMENAGRNLARLAMARFYNFTDEVPKVTLLCGRGGNGGGGLVCARRLVTWGINVQIALTKPADSFFGVPAHQLHILQKMEIPLLSVSELSGQTAPDLIIDALIGYSLKGDPAGNPAQMIQWANTQTAPVLSLDIPSGVQGSTGEVSEPAIQAQATMTLALPKKGLYTEFAKDRVGRLYLADLGVPPRLYEKAFGFNANPLFAESEILELIDDE